MLVLPHNMVFTQGALSLGESFGHERRNALITFFSGGDSGTPSNSVQAAILWYDVRGTYIVCFVVDGGRKNLPLRDAGDHRFMADTKLTRDDAYEEMASTYQCLQIDALNNALKENGIHNAAVRRKICEQFTFAMGNFHDQCWFDSEGQRVHPLLCFSSRFLNVDTDVNDLGDVYTPSDSFSYHEYAFGNNAWYFDEHNEDASGIEHGVFEGDDRS